MPAMGTMAPMPMATMIAVVVSAAHIEEYGNLMTPRQNRFWMCTESSYDVVQEEFESTMCQLPQRSSCQILRRSPYQLL
jgi:hypothetical protein